MLHSSGQTNSTLLSFIAAMLMHQHVQRKAQVELDAFLGVPGKSQLPTAADRQHLPYIDSVMKETLRWQPPVPVGVCVYSFEGGLVLSLVRHPASHRHDTG